jgi:NDP-sugar pyrophosphorylase family protein
MSGFGERFRVAGYKVPKPLIEVEGKSIISHVVDMFPGEEDFLFICNNDHLQNPEFQMREHLMKICPSGQVVGIDAHKLGPVHAVQQVKHLLNTSEQVVVNYCDFTCYWDWEHFKFFVAETRCAGALPAYRGFHPHSLGTTNYAYMRESNGWVTDIQEKKPFTDDRMSEFASSGTYYFRSAGIMLDAFERQVSEMCQTGGEYYVSMAYKKLFKDLLPVAVYPLQHFMQWGTPEDVSEYNRWSAAFRALSVSDRATYNQFGTVIVPMAGMGTRFAQDGYELPKPLIPVSGKPMAIQAIKDAPPAVQYAVVLRNNMVGRAELGISLEAEFPGAALVDLPDVTGGQAITAKLGLEALQETINEIPSPVTFTVCDSGCIYQASDFETAIVDSDADILVWGVRGHPNAVSNPEQYGWLDVDATGKISGVSVKSPLAFPATDPIITGTFTFKNPADALELIESLIARDGRVNGEFYLDSIISDALNAGKMVHLFEVEHFLCWGVPNDLKTFEYWQSCFDKWEGHPYRIEDDARVPKHAVQELKTRFKKILPKISGS